MGYYKPSKRKPHNQDAGYRCERRSPSKRGYVVVYEAEAQGLDVGARWATVCTEHGTMVGSTSERKARDAMKQPDFCEECAQIMRGGQR